MQILLVAKLIKVIVSQCSLSPVIIVFPNVTSVHLIVINVIGVYRLEHGIVIVEIVIALLILVHVSHLVILLHLPLIILIILIVIAANNGLIVLAGLVEE